ncbi:MAG TPA: CoA ester lyase, partial [Caldilineaceae bacterium]|nr:CoA ester lyase [Caldilineaceae bacterium]
MTVATFPRRSFLYVPGDSARKIEKAVASEADTLILDLEDGVALAQKETARLTVGAALRQLDFGPRERLVRLNAIEPGLGRLDAEIAATLPGRPDGYVIPKVEAAETLALVGARLAAAEQEAGIEPGATRLFAMIETARGLLHLPAIAAASHRLAGLIFGAEDFTADVGAQRTPGGLELLYARSAIVTAAAAYGLHAVDAVYLELEDLEGLSEECETVRRLG